MQPNPEQDEQPTESSHLAYAARVETYPRQNVFTGTSNEDDYLADPTSSRRYWAHRTPKTEWEPIDTDRLQERLWAIWGEAYQAYLDLREEQPHGALWLDLRDPAVQRERDKIAEGSRRMTVTEMLAEVVEDWLEERHPANAVMKGDDEMTLDAYEDDQTPMIRGMVSAEAALEALRHHPELHSVRNLNKELLAKALRKVPGWKEIGRVRRHGQGQRRWFGRGGHDGAEWIPAPEEQEDDDLLS